MENIKVGQTINMVGLNITGSLHLSGAQVNGFISLAKAVILGNLDMRKAQISDYIKDELTVKGDAFFIVCKLTVIAISVKWKLVGILVLKMQCCGEI